MSDLGSSNPPKWVADICPAGGNVGRDDGTCAYKAAITYADGLNHGGTSSNHAVTANAGSTANDCAWCHMDILADVAVVLDRATSVQNAGAANHRPAVNYNAF